MNNKNTDNCKECGGSGQILRRDFEPSPFPAYVPWKLFEPCMDMECKRKLEAVRLEKKKNQTFTCCHCRKDIPYDNFDFNYSSCLSCNKKILINNTNTINEIMKNTQTVLEKK